MNLEVCLTPVAYRPAAGGRQRVVVVADIFRATSTICAVLHHGARSVRPVSGLDEARALKNMGAVVAAEEEGLKPSFADFGNDPLEFTPERVRGLNLVMATTNGTRALLLASPEHEVVAGSFLNLSTLADWLADQHSDILVLCAGWKDRESLEDTLYAGALAALLKDRCGIQPSGDAAEMAMLLWEQSKDRPGEVIRRGEHFQRLERLGLSGSVDFILSIDQCPVIPIFRSGVIHVIDPQGERGAPLPGSF